MRYFKAQKRFLTLTQAQKLTVLAQCIDSEHCIENKKTLITLYNRIESLT